MTMQMGYVTVDDSGSESGNDKNTLCGALYIALLAMDDPNAIDQNTGKYGVPDSHPTVSFTAPQISFDSKGVPTFTPGGFITGSAKVGGNSGPLSGPPPVVGIEDANGNPVTSPAFDPKTARQKMGSAFSSPPIKPPSQDPAAKQAKAKIANALGGAIFNYFTTYATVETTLSGTIGNINISTANKNELFYDSTLKTPLMVIR